MLETSARLLALLGLLQSRPSWTGPALAARLDVTDRTVRNDVERLRALGYPVEADRGSTGGYRLGAGATLPPLLLDDDEAVAVAVGLRAARGIVGIEETSARALAKLEQVLPNRLRRQVSALRDATALGPENTGANVADPEIEAALLAQLAASIRDHEQVRFWYRPRSPIRMGDDPAQSGAAAGEQAEPEVAVQVEPYRVVSWQRRWFLVARDPGSDWWTPYRVDWMRLRTPGGPRFRPVALPDGDYRTFVLREVASAGWAYHVRVDVHASAAEVLARINPTVGVVEAVDGEHSVLVTGGDSWEIVAVYLGMLGLDFHVEGPAELVEHLVTLRDRYARAVPSASPGRSADPSGDGERE